MDSKYIILKKFALSIGFSEFPVNIRKIKANNRFIRIRKVVSDAPALE